ncbi:MAG: hypothetical protein HYU36_22610 [Planctomycetes bacterium]|nr:hypothetical protein [Planctomycetota bacterium]
MADEFGGESFIVPPLWHHPIEDLPRNTACISALNKFGEDDQVKSMRYEFRSGTRQRSVREMRFEGSDEALARFATKTCEVLNHDR